MKDNNTIQINCCKKNSHISVTYCMFLIWNLHSSPEPPLLRSESLWQPDYQERIGSEETAEGSFQRWRESWAPLLQNCRWQDCSWSDTPLHCLDRQPWIWNNCKWINSYGYTVNVCYREFHETCHSVTFIVLVNLHQRWKQTRNRVCFHLWCELTLALWCHSIIWSLFSGNKM